jgi:hypothetical protein
MFKVDTDLYGDFLISFLNLQLTIDSLHELIDACTKIIPIENIEECKRLIVSYDDDAKIRKIFESLPLKPDRQPNKFYRDEESYNSIYIWHQIRMGGSVVKDEESETQYPEAIKWLLDEVRNLKDDLTTLIRSMATCKSLPDLFTNGHFINLAKEFPIQKLFLTEKDIEFRPEYPNIWDLGSRYIKVCVSQTFFGYFLPKKNFNRIRFCSLCSNFFIARDMKRRRCYSEDCNKNYKRLQKQEQREKDPAKYY